MKRFIQSVGRQADRVWEVSVQGNEVTTSWGQVGGAMQSTLQTFEALNVGKSNEKSAEQVAESWAARQALLKKRQGYREVDAKGKPLDASSTELTFSALPEHLRFYKPQHHVSGKLQKLIDARKAWFLRKRDGMMHAIVCDENRNLTMYSSTMQRSPKNEPGVAWLDRYPHLVNALRAANLPPKTIILGELCSTDPRDNYNGWNAADDLEEVGGVVQSLTERALTLQRDGQPLSFCVWDVAFWEGENLLDTIPIGDRLLEYARNVCFRRQYLCIPEIVRMHEDVGFYVVGTDFGRNYHRRSDGPSDLHRITELARVKRWEGYVVVDPSATYEGKSISWHGKPDRPLVCGKLKPKFDADFIVRWDPDNGIGERGKGKKSKGVGSVQAYLLDPRTGEEVPISKVGGGLKDADVARFADPSLYPMVWQVEFSGWTAAGSLRYPEFKRVREDKRLDECTIDQRPEQ